MAPPLGESVVTGVLSGLEPRSNGWMRFSILEQGKQYPVKVDTKKPEIIQQATAMMGQAVSAEINCSDSGNPNPNQPGQNFINRYLNKIGPAGTLAAPAATGAPAAADPNDPVAVAKAALAAAEAQAAAKAQQATTAPQGGAQYEDDSVRQLRIMRQSAAKCAAEMFAHLPESQQTPKGVVEVSEALLAYFVYGPGRFGVTAFDAPAPAQTQNTGGDASGDPGPEERPDPEEPSPASSRPAQGVVNDAVANDPALKGVYSTNVNEGPDTCSCGAIAGEFHKADCIPF